MIRKLTPWLLKVIEITQCRHLQNGLWNRTCWNSWIDWCIDLRNSSNRSQVIGWLPIYGSRFYCSDRKSGPLTFEGHRDHPGSRSSERPMKSHTPNRLVRIVRRDRSSRSWVVGWLPVPARPAIQTQWRNLSGYIQVRGGTGLSYRISTNLCMLCFYTNTGCPKIDARLVSPIILSLPSAEWMQLYRTLHQGHLAERTINSPQRLIWPVPVAGARGYSFPDRQRRETAYHQ